MKHAVFCLLAWLLFAGSAQAGVVVLRLEGAVGPAVSDYVQRGIQRAEAAGSDAVVLEMDTPGGLDSSMRDIIQAVLGSRVPVIGYVAPRGARAASAGTYILYATHVAAMAPATNLGAATPVQIGGLPSPPGSEPPERPEPAKDDAPEEDKAPEEDEDGAEEAQEEGGEAPEAQPKTAMERKLVNDARAYIRSLAQLRGRNAEWAEQAVTEAASLSAEDALEKGVIDLVAEDRDALLDAAHGREVRIGAADHPLDVRGKTVEVVEPDWRTRLLAVITDPQVAYILMMLGVYGLFFELANPGSIFPGVLGAVSLLLALFAFQVLPINYAGLALILLGIVFMIGEAFAPSFGALGLGGIVAFVAGSLMLWEEEGPGFELPVALIAGVALTTGVVLIGLGTMFARLRLRPPVSGDARMLGATGVATADFDGRGWIRVQGESWQARCASPVKKGQRLRVAQRDGLVLVVEPEDEGSKR